MIKKTALLALLTVILAAFPAAAIDLRVVGGESMGIPFWLSADLGLVMGSRTANSFRGLKVSGEIGIGGTKGFLGYYTSTQKDFVRTALSVGPAVMRTFGSPLLADDWRTFLGVEAQLSVTAFMPITLRFGVYTWVEEFHPQFTAGFGIGL